MTVRQSPGSSGQVRSKIAANRNRVTIPVFPHVKKFILKTYRTSDPIKVEEYNVLGRFVTLALLDKRARKEQYDYRGDKLNSSLTLILSAEQAKLSPRLSKLIRINIDLDRLFKDHLLTSIYANKVSGIPPYNACKMFLDHYGIDEKEYSLDAAYRFWLRNKD